MSIAKLDNPSILVVDDDKFQRTLAQRILTREGYEVRTASDGVRALQSILEGAPDIVLTDWNMPIMDGLELCRNIRENEVIPFVFVILITAEDATTDRLVEAFDAGVDDYLTKPLNERELLARLRSAQRTIKLQRELSKHSLQAHRANAEMEVANSALSKANNRLDLLATTDELTGLYNRREANERLANAWSASKRFGEPLSCIMIDIDHFKSFNDTHGHLIGDLILKETASVLQRAVREHEHAFRIGGEEFFVICPKTSEDEAAIAAERIRKMVSQNIVEHDSLSLSVTISLGVAGNTPLLENPDQLRQAADEALYAAKHAGRNRVCCAQDSPAPATPKDDAILPPPSETDARPLLSVLLVDSDPASAAKTRRLLVNDGHTVCILPSNTPTADFATKHHPDIVVIDGGTKESTNVSFTRSFRSTPETHLLPLILLSARSDGSDVLAGIGAGADDFLTKPLNPSELALRVRTAQRRREELSASNSVRGEQTRVLGVISDLSRSLAAARGLDCIIEHTLASTAELLCSNSVAALRPANEGRALAIAGQLGAENANTATDDIPIAGSAIGRLFTGKEPFLITTGDEPATDFCDAERDLLCRRPSVAVALCGPGNIVGVLIVAATGSNRTISTLDLVYMDLIGNMAGAAIHDALSRQKTEDAQVSIVIALATLAEYRDSDTGLHLDRVTQYSLLLSEQLRREGPYRELITDTLVADLERAVPLHDIGKVAIPDHILLKPGKLTDEEFDIMKTHTTIGARTIDRLVQRSPGVSFLVAAQQIAHSHHEWFNGRGYPQGLTGQDIPLSARIATVADVYDAITTSRPYKEAMSHEKAAEIIYTSSGTHFDPHVVEAFNASEEAFRSLSLELADRIDEAPSPVPALPLEHGPR
jgi:diguanylate cyclase (GGDEF)-like protein